MTPPPQPTRPVLSWYAWRGARAAGLPAVDDLPHRQVVTSGRAAIAMALEALRMPPGSTVLAPSYHCPTLVAPLRAAGMNVQFYPLNDTGQPRLDGLTPAPGARALLAMQLFGLPQSLTAVRQWCDAHQIALIEDCAHSFFGWAGERPVGHWGDVATASLTKFFPVSEAGLMASATARTTASLAPAGMRQQVKAVVDVLERATQHHRLPGLQVLLGALFALKNRRAAPALPAPTPDAEPSPPPATAEPESQWIQDCDLSRTRHGPTVADRVLLGLPRERIVEARRAHFKQLLAACNGLTQARPWLASLPDGAAPYALPLWVADEHRAEAAYTALRHAGCAVFRWDRVWPGCPTYEGDTGAVWRRQMLQLLCHQDLTVDDLAHTASVLRRVL